MRDEMLVCSVDRFLEKLAPFSPDVQWIENAYDHLWAKGLLGTPAEMTRLIARTAQRKTGVAALVRVNATPDARATEPKVDAENADIVKWKAYRYAEPQQMEKNEMKIFKPLEDIVQALLECPDRGPGRKRMSNGYRYNDCPYKDLQSEITGANFRVDAAIVNPDIYKGEEDISWAAAQTAVVMEFKKEATPNKVYENRKQLVGAANHIMNDDPRRNWMYGITIENTDMSLWYFSRSYSMKSTPFDFTKGFKTFIRVFLSFLYATDEELGHDPSIHRKYYEQKWCYVYELKTEEGPKYYRTLESLYNPRYYCITGRKSRVWKVVEVPSLDDLESEPNQREVALKDCWVDEGSLSEKEIQTHIFKRLKGLKEADYAWAPQGLKMVLKDGVACPDKYFMKVEWDWKSGLNKERPPSHADSNLLSDPIDKLLADKSKTILSTQTPPRTAYPSPHASNVPTPIGTSGDLPYLRRQYKVKQHYRVVYAEVGTSLASAASLSDAVRAFEDIFIALTLMFLVRWVHRDVSEGNIILVRGEHGVRAKLNDLEYAQFFSEEGEVASTDPKTGTPYFMPIEIHKGAFIFDKPASTKAYTYMLVLNRAMIPQPAPAPPSLRFNFAHDMESLWWIMVWTIVVRVKGGPWLYEMIFTSGDSPHSHRDAFFKKGDFLHDHLKKLIHETLCDYDAHTFLVVCNLSLCEFYASGKRQDATSYHSIYETVWGAMEYFIQNMSGVDMVLEDPHLRDPPPPISLPITQELRKRTRLPDDSGFDRKTTVEEGSSRKKQKSGVDVFTDVDEENAVEEDTVQGVSGIAVGDGNPRIRVT